MLQNNMEEIRDIKTTNHINEEEVRKQLNFSADTGFWRRIGIATFDTFQEALRWFCKQPNRSSLEIVKVENGYRCQLKGSEPIIVGKGIWRE